MPHALLEPPSVAKSSIAPTRVRAPAVPRGTDPGEPALSELFGDISASGRGLGPAVLLQPARAVRMTRLLLRLPRIDVLLPAGADRRAVARALRSNTASRTCTLGVTAVLALPTAPGGYLEGHDRATVRRKARAAERRGVTIRPVPPSERPRLLALADEHERTNERAEYRCADPRNDDLLDHDLWLAAWDADDRPIVLAVIPVSGRWATLRYFRTLEASSVSSDARYLLAAGLAEALRDAGVRWLADTTRPHWLPNGLRHFQRMLGFRLVRLRIPRGRVRPAA